MEKLIKICAICGIAFDKPYTTGLPEWSKRKYCSVSCQHKGLIKNDRNRVCLVCNKAFICATSNLDAKFCSLKCSAKGVDWHSRPQSRYNPNMFNTDKVPCNCGCGTLIRKYDNRGRSKRYVEGHTMKGKKRVVTWGEKLGESIRKNGKLKGSKHWNWKGGKYGETASLRHTKEYKYWRLGVYKRDNYSCIHCGIHCTNKNIVAHHIKSFKDFPDSRFDINNGVTLCRKDHLNLHRGLVVLGA